MRVGILSLQGAVEPHAEKLRALGVDVVAVRRAEHLSDLAGIVLPGGESTTMLHLLAKNELWDPLQQFLRERPSFGVCAGAILLAKEVQNPQQRSFGVLDATVTRNAYGRQTESFVTLLPPASNYLTEPQEGVFIRAPRFERLGKTVSVLFRHNDEPVCVEDGPVLAASFHPELSPGASNLHRRFVERCAHAAR